MTDIKVSINNGMKKLQFNVLNASDQLARQILSASFDGIYDRVTIRPSQGANAPKPNPSAHSTITPVASKESQPYPRPARQTQLLNSERTLTTNLGEKMGQVLGGDSNWYASGIKYKNGVPHYRCRYWCPNEECKCSSNQYIQKDDKTTECHECGTILKVRPANPVLDTSTGLPFRDSYGNFFRADKEVNPEAGGK